MASSARVITLLACVSMVPLVWSGGAAAKLVTAELPYADYGHNQNDGGRCAATSMINSFGFLAKTYPDVYKGTRLTTGDPKSAETPIRQLDDLMAGGGCGVGQKQIWEGKLAWFDKYAPGTTTFAGMTDQDFSTWKGKGFLTKGLPTADFLLGQIEDGEDVEFGFGIAGDGKHFATLTGITVDDATDMAVSLEYIDPNCVNGTNKDKAGPSKVAVTATKADGIHFDWKNGDGLLCSGAAADANIDVAFAESPIPEPAAIALFAVGLAGIGVMRHRQAQATA
jgi:hypothetical protein